MTPTYKTPTVEAIKVDETKAVKFVKMVQKQNMVKLSMEGGSGIIKITTVKTSTPAKSNKTKKE